MTYLDHPGALFFAVFFLLLVVLEAGFRLGQATEAKRDEVRHEQLVGTRDGIFVLLSLLLGFTLALAVPRADLRHQLMVDEANSIGTTALRAEVLLEPYRANVGSILRQYVDARLRFFDAGTDEEKINQAQDQTKQLQQQLWQQAVGAAQAAPTAITSTFLQALNETIDLSEKRLAALENRIPPSVWIMLLAIAILGCFTTGFSMRRRSWLPIIITPLMIAVVMSLIADLDTSRTGFIRVEQSSMQRLKHDLQGAPRGTAPNPTH